MFKSNNVFTYITSIVGVNQDGEKYFAINVMSKETHKIKLSFTTKNEDVISKLSQMKYIDFQDVVLHINFDTKYIAEKKICN